VSRRCIDESGDTNGDGAALVGAALRASVSCRACARLRGAGRARPMPPCIPGAPPLARHAGSGAPSLLACEGNGHCRRVRGAVRSRRKPRACWLLLPTASPRLTVALACPAPARALTRSQAMTSSAVRGLGRSLAGSGQKPARLSAPLPTMMADAAVAPTKEGKAVLIFSW
jgi:hypothetical protein